MGRPKKSAPSLVEPEDNNQEYPDEESARTMEPAGHGSNGRYVNQAELVRRAVAAGHKKPAAGVPYIKIRFGVDITPKYYSVAKSQLKKMAAKVSFAPELAKRGPKPKAAEPAAEKPLVDGYDAPSEKPKAAGEPIFLLTMEGVKELVGQFWAERVRKMVDL